jgi:hypothetical protein
MAFDLTETALSIGSLGTAAFGLVDASKAFAGGISNRGFSYVVKMLERVLAATGKAGDSGGADSYKSMLAVLRANWLNGALSLVDQKAVAKTLIKLRLNETTAPQIASVTGVNSTILTSVSTKYANGEALTQEEQGVVGRFDLELSTIIDEAYQRADQTYRNSAKVLAVVFAVLLAIAGKLALGSTGPDWGPTIIAGFLAAPLAPVSKDLASALQATVKTLQFLKK